LCWKEGAEDMESMKFFGMPDYRVSSLVDGVETDPVLLEIKLEKVAVEYIRSLLEMEGNPASTQDILMLITGRFKNLAFDVELSQKHIEEVWGMDKAIKYLLLNHSHALTKQHLYDYNSFVVVGSRKTYAGRLRETDVTIGGTRYSPPQFELLPRLFENMFSAIEMLEGTQNKALSYLLAISKNQFFIDGNKRTARLAAMHVCLNKGLPSLSFDIDTQLYLRCLKDFYEESKTEGMVEFYSNNLISL
jgi:fido (protein-threonine AMPylation protein)